MTDGQRRRRLRIWAIVTVLVLLALAAVWRWTPLHEYAQPRLVAHWLRVMAQSAWMPLLMTALYVLSNAVMFPNTVLCFGTILALGTHPGLMYATVGSLLAALAAYALGRRYGPDKIKHLEVESLARMSEALRKGGVLQITILRLLPLAPFSVVNIMAGASRVGVLPFTIGTLLGMLPGNLLFTVFGRQLRQLLSNPTPMELAAMVAVTLVASAAFWYLHRLTLPAKG
jgi:phospholipase D1/2